MKRVALILLMLVLSAPLARGDDQQAYLDGLLKAWQDGDAPPQMRLPMRVRRLVRCETVSTVVARLNGIDTTIVNTFCTFERDRRWGDDGATPGGETTWRVVFRVSSDPDAPDGFRVSAAWRDLADPSADLRFTPQPSTPQVLTPDQRAAATRLIAQLRNPKLDPAERNRKRDELVEIGPGVVEIALRDLRTANMEHRREIAQIVRRLRPIGESRILREELAAAVPACIRIVQRIQDDAVQAAEYRDRAAKIKQPAGGTIGGLKFKPEATERESFLRLAAKFDDKVADSRRELDACVEVLETSCEHLARYGAPEDLALLTTLVSDKCVTLRATAWSRGVIADDEHAQTPPVGFSTRRNTSASGQEQDWLPWGPLWGTLRTLVGRVGTREPLLDLRDQMEKAFVPLEKKRGPWQQTCLVTEFQRTEGLVLDRLAAADGPAPKPAAAVEYAREARDRVLATLGPAPAEKPGEDAWDKRRKLARYNELRRGVEFDTWHVAMKSSPATPADAGPASPSAKPQGGPSFTTEAFDFYKEILPVTAVLDSRQSADGATTRIVLGTFDLPMRATVAAEVASGKRPARLEFVGRMLIMGASARTFGAITELSVSLKVARVALLDDRTGEVLSELKPAP